MVTRVAFVINKVSHPGGAERVMSILCSEFANRNIAVKLIVQESLEKAYPLNNAVEMINTPVSVKIPILRTILRQFKLRAHIKDFKPEIVISFMTDMNILVLIASLGMNIPVIISERNDPKQTKRFFDYFRKLVYPLAKGYVFQTEDARAYFPLSIKEKSRIISNPIFTDLPERSAQSPTYEIVAVGRLVSQKNHRLLLHAFVKFRQHHSKYKLKIYGDGPLKNQLEELISKLEISDAVSLMGTDPNVLNSICNADMFILTSNYEGMPNALAEALAIGIPCISTDCSGGGARFLINNEVNGILVPVEDKDQIASKMCKLADNYNWSQQLGNEAKKLKINLDVRTITEEWIEYCNSIVEGE